MYTDIHKGTEVGDVRHNAWQLHAFVQVFNGLDATVKLEGFNLFARVSTWLLQFFHDVRQGRETNLRSDILLDVYRLARTFIIN